MNALLAALLLSCPSIDPPAEPSPELLAALQSWAIDLEIMDARERRWRFARPDELSADLKTMRRRWADLQDAPPLCDAERFPERAAVSEFLAFNREYRKHIEARNVVRPSEDGLEDLEEVDRLYQLWDAVRDARCEYYYVTDRRSALKRVRDTVGPENYAAGRLPCYVPLWRFREMP